jgi:hypothetical protein
MLSTFYASRAQATSVSQDVPTPAGCDDERADWTLKDRVLFDWSGSVEGFLQHEGESSKAERNDSNGNGHAHPSPDPPEMLFHRRGKRLDDCSSLTVESTVRHLLRESFPKTERVSAA